MAERSETAVGTTTGGPRAKKKRPDSAPEATASLSAAALAAELAAPADTVDPAPTPAPQQPADASAGPAEAESDAAGPDKATAEAPSKADAEESKSGKPGEDAAAGTAPTRVIRAATAGRAAAEKAAAEAPSKADAEKPESGKPGEDAAEATAPTRVIRAAGTGTAAADEPQADEPAENTPEATAPTRVIRAADAKGEESAAAQGDEPEAEPADAADAEATVVLPAAPERHSGDRIANRYRLEECITQEGGFSSWRAMDEKLRRAVGIHLLAAAHPRAKATVAAARQAALLGDPRFVQVLDAVDDGEMVYIVREWLPDATGMDTLLLEDVQEPYEAYQLVRQVSEALAAAHRRGLSHLRLTPACVLRTDSGQYRVDGIAVSAALRGLDAADEAEAALRDTRAIGALLFAALTRRWPYPEDRHGLQGLPKDLGTVPAERVRAGVHRGLSDLTARTLCTPPGGKLEPITTPDELAKAVTALPKVRQPAPEPLVLPEYPTHRQGAATTVPGAPMGPREPVAAPRPPSPLPGRSGKALKWAVSLVVLAAIGLGSWGTAEALMDRNNGGTGTQQQGQSLTGQGNDGSGRHTPKALPIAGDREFSPLDPQTIAGAQAGLAIDNNPTTAWTTSSYKGYPNFGNLPTRKDGSGILIDLGSVRDVSEVKVVIPSTGQTMEILAAPGDDTSTAPTDLSGFTQRISNRGVVNGTTLDSGVLATPVKTRYVLVHVTELPPDPTQADHFRGGITEIQVLG